MAVDQPGPPEGSNPDQPGRRPTEPLARPVQPPGQAPVFAPAGPPPEALVGFWRRLVAAFLDSLLVGLAYFTYFHATIAGQSIGNKIMGIRVLDASTGRPLTYVRAFVRALRSGLSAIPFFLGYLWTLWEPRKRTWHDIVADSLVVRAIDRGDEFGRPVR
jgi:uncharacterized RDD family membrane protein YckC